MSKQPSRSADTAVKEREQRPSRPVDQVVVDRERGAVCEVKQRIPQQRKAGPTAKPRGPPDSEAEEELSAAEIAAKALTEAITFEADAFSLERFCRRHGISLQMYYKLATQGLAPQTFNVGTRVLVSKGERRPLARRERSRRPGRAPSRHRRTSRSRSCCLESNPGRAATAHPGRGKKKFAERRLYGPRPSPPQAAPQLEGRANARHAMSLVKFPHKEPVWVNDCILGKGNKPLSISRTPAWRSQVIRASETPTPMTKCCARRS